MYDFITVTDSKEMTEIIFAYAEPKDNIRKETFLQKSITFTYKNGKTITVSAMGKGPIRPKHTPLCEGTKIWSRSQNKI